MTTEINSMTYIKYIIVTFFIGCLFILSGMVTGDLGDYSDIVLKIVLILLICVYAVKHDSDFISIFNIKFSPAYLLIIIVPLIFSFVLTFSPLDFEPYPYYVILTVVGTITTVIWEELYFRYIGCSLFEENGRYRWYNLVFLALVFSGTHAVNIMSQSAFTTITQLLFTIGLGIFLLALYIATGSIILPMIAHFLINSVNDYFNLHTTMGPYLADTSSTLVLIIYVIVFIAISAYILKKQDKLC